MGSNLTADVKPNELIRFRKLNTDTLLDSIVIPERPENRKATDIKFLIAFGVFIVLLMPFLIYTLAHADMDRFLEKYDSCGNTCGKKNVKYDEWNCTGKDYTESPFLQFDIYTGYLDEKELMVTPRRCVRDRPKYYEPNIRSSYIKELAIDFVNNYADERWMFGISCVGALSITLGAAFLFRYVAAFVVWISIIVVICGFAIITGIFWFFLVFVSLMGSSGMPTDFLCVCIAMTITVLALIFVTIYLRKKIRLFCILLREAMIAIFAMPQLLLAPTLALLAKVTILVLFVTSSIYMTTSGVLTEYQEGFLFYKHTIVMYFTQVFNLVAAIWAFQLVVGIQYMIVAGATAVWYFAKNKNFLDGPLLKSTYITFKFHLGTIACGSLFITLVATVRALISAVLRIRCLRAMMRTCLEPVEVLLRFLSYDAYVLTAMHGKPLYKSGNRAARVVLENGKNVVSFNFVGGFVFFMLHLMMAGASCGIPYFFMALGGIWNFDFETDFLPFLIVALISLVISTTFFSLCKAVIDTMFLCFCEDCLLNDGMTRPYAMPKNLMQFVDRSKHDLREERE